MTSPQAEPFRCRRAVWCADREPVRDPVMGDHTGWVGADLVDRADGLCEVCERDVVDALVHLPGDVADLTRILGRPLSSALREPVTGPALGPSIPIWDDIEALRALIDHESCSWAGSVAQAAGVPWSTLMEHHSRIGHRVRNACLLLHYRLREFLSLGLVEHRTRSLSARRADGHDPDVVTRFGDDYWVHRDGITGALTLLDLHRRAWRAALRHDSMVPAYGFCPSCQQPALRRRLGEGDATCSHCRHVVSEQWLDVLRTVAGNCRTVRDVEVLTAALTSTRPAP